MFYLLDTIFYPNKVSDSPDFPGFFVILALRRKASKEGETTMHALTKLIKDDMKPALGVTEPGAIAFAVASAAERIGGGDRAEVGTAPRSC